MKFLGLLFISLILGLNAFGQSKKAVMRKAIRFYEDHQHYGVGFEKTYRTLGQYDTNFYSGFLILEDRKKNHWMKITYRLNPDDSVESNQWLFWKLQSDSIYMRYAAGQLYARPRSTYSGRKYTLYLPSHSKGNNDMAEYLRDKFRKRRKWNLSDTVIEGNKLYLLERRLKNRGGFISFEQTHRKLRFLVDSASGAIIQKSYTSITEGFPTIEKFTYRYLGPRQIDSLLHFAKSLIDTSTRWHNGPVKNVIRVREGSSEPGDTIKLDRFMLTNGDSIGLYDLDKDYYVLDFWYTACGPCVKSIEKNTELSDALQELNAEIYGVTVHYDDRTFVEEFAKRKGCTYPLLFSSNLQVYNKQGIRLYPTMLLINRRGIILAKYEGMNIFHNKKILRAIERDRQKKN